MSDIVTLRAEDLERHMTAGQPMRITEAIDHWSAMRKWDSEYLKVPATATAIDVPYFTAPAAGNVLHQYEITIDFSELIEDSMASPNYASTGKRKNCLHAAVGSTELCAPYRRCEQACLLSASTD